MSITKQQAIETINDKAVFALFTSAEKINLIKIATGA